MSAFRLRWLAAAALFGSGAMGACGGDQFTLLAGDAGGPSDSGGGGDAAPSDAGTDADAPSFCAMVANANHLLCDDFDVGVEDMPSKDTHWDSFNASPTADGRIDKLQAFSQPRSLSVFSLMSAPGTETFALFAKSLGHAKTVEVGFKVMVEQYGGDGTLATATALASITFGTVSYSLIAASPTQVVLSETLTPDGGTMQTMSHPAASGLGTGRWVDVQIQLVLPQATSMGSFALVIDSSAVGGALSYPTGLSPSGAMLLGFYVKSSPNIWRVRYDNVVIDKTN
jgi:hypothetical protein